MGLNMPARTVVFTALRKWDGEEHRWAGGQAAAARQSPAGAATACHATIGRAVPHRICCLQHFCRCE